MKEQVDCWRKSRRTKTFEVGGKIDERSRVAKTLFFLLKASADGGHVEK